MIAETTPTKAGLSHFSERRKRWEAAKASRTKVVSLTPSTETKTFTPVRIGSETKPNIETGPIKDDSMTKRKLFVSQPHTTTVQDAGSQSTSSTPSTLFGAPKTTEASVTSSFSSPVANSQSGPYADGSAKDNVLADATEPGAFSHSGRQEGSSSTAGGSRPAFKARSTKPTETKTSNGRDSKLATSNPFGSTSSTSNPFSTLNAMGAASPTSAAPFSNAFSSLSAPKNKDDSAAEDDRPNPFSFAATKSSLPDVSAQGSVPAAKTEELSSLVSPAFATSNKAESQSRSKTQEDKASMQPCANYRERLVEFYKKYNKEKLDSVDTTLASYKGKEEKLFQKLEEKYVTGKDGILPASGNGPTCFMEFSIGGVNKGRVVVKLYQNMAPLATENFQCLCTGEKGMGRAGKQLAYQFSKVHRVVPGFCVQLGDFTKANGTGGESIYPPNSEHGDMWGKFKDEAFMQHSKKGLLSMANNGAHRNSSQFFFTLKALPNLDGKHVVFGEVVEGMDIVEQIGALTTNAKQFPDETVVVERCGEIKDGKDVISESTLASTSATKSPFGFGQSPSPFGSTSSSMFGGTKSSKAFGTTSPFGASALSSGAPSSAGSLFGAAPTPSPFATSSSKPFSSGFNSGATATAAPAPGALSFGSSPSPFSFSAKSKETTAAHSEVPKSENKTEAPAPLANSTHPPMLSTKASTLFGALQSKSSSGAYPPMSMKAPTAFGVAKEPTKTTTVSASSSSYPPMSTKAPAPFGAAKKLMQTPVTSSASSSSYPPMSTKAPAPFGTAKKPTQTPVASSASSSSYPPMSTKAPTPFAAKEPTKTAPVTSASNSFYPPMSTKAPAPFGVAKEPTKTTTVSASSSSYPPMSTKAPAPFGFAKEPTNTLVASSASSSSYPPMSTKAPTPFGAAKKPMQTPVASSSSSSSYPPMSTKAPAPFAAKEPTKTAPVTSASSSKSAGVLSFGSPSSSGMGFGSWAPTALTVLMSTPDSVGTNSAMSPRPEPSDLAASVFDQFDEKKTGSLPVDKFEDMTDDLGEGFHGAEYDRQIALVDPSGSGVMQRSLFIDWYVALVTGEKEDFDKSFDSEERDERLEEELKARKMFAELAAADATIGVADFPKLIESLGTVYCDDEHWRTLEELRTSGDRIHRKDFVAWHIAWLFGEYESDEEELTLCLSYGSPRSEGWSKLFQVDKDSWKCEVCSMRKSGDTKACPACETPKPGCEEDVDKANAAPNDAPGAIGSGDFSFGVSIDRSGFSVGVTADSTGESNTEKTPAASETAFSPDSSTMKGATSGNLAPSFGTGPAAPSFGSLPSSQPVFGADSFISSFGTTSATGFGAAASSKTAFSAAGSVMSSFGATSSTPVFGANLSTPSFGTESTAPSFGTASSKPVFGAGSTFDTGSTAPLFGAASSKPEFGAGSTAPSFGVASASSPFGKFESSGFKTSDTSSSNLSGGISSKTTNLLPVSGGKLESPTKDP